MNDIAWSEGADISTLDPQLKDLLSNGWTMTSDGKGIKRSFHFKSFKKTWEFMNAIAEQCKVAKHHPEWSNVYNTTIIRWTTHSPSGLSEKDITMAVFSDEMAVQYEEVRSEKVTGEAMMVREGLADEVVKVGGECCVPKKTEQTKSRSDGEVPAVGSEVLL